MARVHVILVNWNGHRDTIECLESLLRLDGDPPAVLVIDNGSADGSVDAIRAWAQAPEGPPPDVPAWAGLPADRRFVPAVGVVGPDGGGGATQGTGVLPVTVIAAGRNLGFAAANNLGMRIAAGDSEARFFWLLNNDTVVRPDALVRLERHAAAHPEQGLIGALLLDYHRPGTIQGLGGWSRPDRAIAGHIGYGLPADAVPGPEAVAGQLAYVMGAAMFVRRELFHATGGMGERYFLYFEELDWAKRLPPGVTQGVCADAAVLHKEGASIGTSSVARPSDTSLYYHAVNTLRFFWRFERRHIGVAVARLGWNAWLHARKGDRAGVRVIARALADAASGRRRRGPYGSAEFRG